MIGVALVSASAVFAASLRNTFTAAMDRGVTADWVVTADGLRRCSPTSIAETLAEVPELSAVTGVRGSSRSSIDGDEKQVRRRRPRRPRAAHQRRPRGRELGGPRRKAASSSTTTPPRTSASRSAIDASRRRSRTASMREFPVAGIYSDAYLVGNWLMSSTVARRDRHRRADRLLRGHEDRRRRQRGRGRGRRSRRRSSSTRRRSWRPPTSSRTRRRRRSTSCS